MIFLGCDGGSTKTEWVLADETGKVLAHRIFPGCNYAFLGQEGFNKLIMDSCSQLLSDAQITADQITGAYLGLTVYGEVPGTEETIPAALRAALPGCTDIRMENDSVVGWAGSLALRPGVNMVAGTGSVAFGRDPKHTFCRVGGWSLFFADEGSCSWVARQMITEFVKQADGRHPRTVIYDALRKELNIDHDPYFSGYLQTDIRADSSLLAKMQPVCLAAARQGDPAALAIYQRAAEELTEHARAVRDQLDFPAGEKVQASYSGGLFRAGDVILKPFEAEMEKAGFTIAPPKYSPVMGALALAAEPHMELDKIDHMLEKAAASV